ncbi:MAG: RNA 2',3'-cyclic phosphodiesterase [Bacteroidia bacterium]|nr:RNA 2',3'-cyclic phosphodiesterase [Bacteroidia bacterium]
MRLFIGLALPPEASLWILSQRPKYLPPKARWIPPDQWHLTLTFLGERPSCQVELIHQKVAPLFESCAAFFLRFLSLGWKAYTLWIFLESHPRLAKLSYCLHEALGLSSAFSFQPHITIARSRQRMEEKRAVFHEPPLFLFTTAYLYESILSPSGAVYRPLRRYDLREE